MSSSCGIDSATCSIAAFFEMKKPIQTRNVPEVPMGITIERENTMLYRHSAGPA